MRGIPERDFAVLRATFACFVFGVRAYFPNSETKNESYTNGHRLFFARLALVSSAKL